MDDYAGRVLADRYRLPLPPSDEYELKETRAFDTYSGQEVLVRQVPLPEVVEAEVLDAEGLPDGFTARNPQGARRSSGRNGARRPTEPAVRRAVEAAQAAARIPDHPRLDQVFDVFAEGGSLWVVSELVAARPLAALLAEKPLTPYRAAEVASDVLTALRVLHAHGWVHRNITARTVLVCDDGRVMLTGLAVGAAEEALCGYDPVPVEAGEWGSEGGEFGAGSDDGGPGGAGGPTAVGAGAGGAAGFGAEDPEAARRAAIEAREARGLPSAGVETGNGAAAPSGALVRREADGGTDIRAARAGAIAAYRAGARAAARVQEAQNGRAALPGARPAPENDPAARTYGDDPAVQANGATAPFPSVNGATESPFPPAKGVAQSPYPAGNGVAQPPYPAGANGVEHVPGAVPPGQIADPYGVRPTSWHGAAPRAGVADLGQAEQGRTALPPSADRGGAGDGRLAGPGFGGAPGVPVPPLGQAPGAGQDAVGYAGVPDAPRAPGGTVPSLGQGAGTDGRGFGGAPDAHRAPGGPVPSLGQGSDGGRASGAPTRWDELAPAGPVPARRGPATALAAERARQARMAVVGPVTERWAPEQAGPVHENWQLAAPIGPATDLWALGALLFRAVQGHAPYPEESTAELVQLVCAEPPAFAEECGPLRPVVESLLRQDPTERLEFEELRGWLRSLVRSAPEPEAGAHVVAAPPVDASRLPIIRRRGELVRRRRAGLPATSAHGRHKRAREEAAPSPRRLGRTLLLLVLLMMAAAIAYAMYFMPKSDADDKGSAKETGSTSQAGPAQSPEPSGEAGGSEPRPEQTTPEPSRSSSGAAETQTAGPEVADGFTLRTDAEGFKVAVAKGWDRTPRNGQGQVVYAQGSFELIVVPGRDTAAVDGSDPMVYQREKEPELQPYRDSSWATATGLKSIQVGTRAMAEGQFTWTDSEGRELYVRNLAILIGGKYHVVQVRGPEAERDEVTRLYEQASATYQVTG
ncbi:protein kinase [Streptomyces sp. SID13726]|uniref:protein kinase n=1 Tax=Streptomyces sp. SID13726 TaxID=2706058 RepID=UPI0013BAB007|nr:protein kinase [Streptomyces sp. SID13726]